MGGKTIVHIDGVSGVGKTTAIKYIESLHKVNCIYNDYYEITKKAPEFYCKYNNKELEILYVAFQFLNINTFSYPHKHTIVDRSPLSSLWYVIIFNILEEFKHLETTDSFIEELKSNETTPIKSAINLSIKSALSPYMASSSRRHTFSETPLQKLMHHLMEEHTTIMITTSNIDAIATAVMDRGSDIEKQAAESHSFPMGYNYLVWYVYVQNRVFQTIRDDFLSPFHFYEVRDETELLTQYGKNKTIIEYLHKRGIENEKAKFSNIFKYGYNIKKLKKSIKLG
ncbi:HZV_115-like protein [Penaeus monodon nudivirus]|uniref:HZV_115-like protein n=1 Tax=Penaeus monodon nudivirus TaxID=1529056 RepID=A0A076FDS3_9VIRU|nr:HZV_115-like protein [Penaeus monodon nudivirus]AII15805.1 HZV_115-like protein [Penaeus monodon nudivirus]